MRNEMLGVHPRRYQGYRAFPEKWNYRFLNLAKYVSEWSKDPSTKVGAVIADSDYRVVSLGYNGFPRGIADDGRLVHRNDKYKIIVHAERNAILFSQRSLAGCRLYTWPILTCSQCAAMIIQTGIIEVVSIQPDLEVFERWKFDLQLAERMYKEVGLRVTYLTPGTS